MEHRTTQQKCPLCDEEPALIVCGTYLVLGRALSQSLIMHISYANSPGLSSEDQRSSHVSRKQ